MAAGAFAAHLGLAWVRELGFRPGYYTNPGKLGTQRTKKNQQSKTPEASAAFLPLDMTLLCALDKIPVAKI
jgi:hypothetical protein